MPTVQEKLLNTALSYPQRLKIAADEIKRLERELAGMELERDNQAELLVDAKRAHCDCALQNMEQSQTCPIHGEVACRLAEAQIEENHASDLALTLGTLLSRTADALKGDPGELKEHSTHDIPEVAAGIVAEFAESKRDVERLENTIRLAHYWLPETEDHPPHIRDCRNVLRNALEAMGDGRIDAARTQEEPGDES